MADSKLSELVSATGVGPSDLLYVVQGNSSKKVAVSSLAQSLATSIATVNIAAGTVSTSTSAGSVGQIRYDATYLYLCVSSNTWIRALRNSW